MDRHVLQKLDRLAVEGRIADATTLYLRDAAWRGERMVALARLVVMGLLLAQSVVLDGALLAAGAAKPWVVVVACLAGALLSVPALLTPRSDRSVDRRLVVSVVLDTVLFVALVIPAVLWPLESYRGLLQSPYLAGLVVTTIASGLRLSKTATVAGVLSNAVGLVGLLGVEWWLRRDMLWVDESRYVTMGVIFVAAAVVAAVASKRTRRLVVEAVDGLARAEKTRQRLGAYISEELVGMALEGTEPLESGRRRPVAVLFSDLRGFTRYAEHMEPEQLVSELNAYLSVMVEVIRGEGGVVDKYIGDAIMAVFGIPEGSGEDALRAIRAAVAMQEALVAHNVERASRGLPALAQGIGVHFGEAVAGNIGTPSRLQFTVIGDAVNAASRLESATKTMGVGVIISEAAVESARSALAGRTMPEMLALGTLEVRGKDEAMTVMTVASPRGAGVQTPDPMG